MMTDSAQKPRWSRFDVVMAIIAFAVAVLFVGAGVLLYLEKSSQHEAMTQAYTKIASLKNRGAPINADSLQALYVSRTSPNDTAEWNNIYDYLESKEFTSQCVGVVPLSPYKPQGNVSTLDLQRTLIEKNADFLKRVHALASRRQPAQFVLDYSPNHELYRHLTNQRQLSRLLSCEYSVRAADKDSASILDTLSAALSIRSTVQGEDLMVSHLVCSVIQGVAISNVKSSIEQDLLNQTDLEALTLTLKTLPSSVQNWRQIVEYERGWLLPYLQGLTVFDHSGNPIQDYADVRDTNGKDLLNYLNYMEQVESVNWSSWKSAKQQLNVFEVDLNKKVDSATFWNRHNWKSTSIAVSSWSAFGQVLARNVSDRNLAILGCTLRLYKIKRGVFPDRLEQLVDVGIDFKQYPSMADLPFGYQCTNGIAYLWGPVQDGPDIPLEISTTVPIGTSPHERESVQKALWTLQP